LKIKKSYESYEAHTFYNSLEDIGIEDGKETIEQIAKKLPSYSTLFYGKTGKKESDKIYPFRSGTVKVSKMNTAHKVSFLFLRQSHFSIGYYDLTDPDNAWTGWTNLLSRQISRKTYFYFSQMGISDTPTIKQIFEAMDDHSSAVIDINEEEGGDAFPVQSGVLLINKVINKAEFRLSNDYDQYIGIYNTLSTDK